MGFNMAKVQKSRQKREHYYYQFDYMLLFMTVAIALFGILMIYSASSYTASTSRFGNTCGNGRWRCVHAFDGTD